LGLNNDDEDDVAGDEILHRSTDGPLQSRDRTFLEAEEDVTVDAEVDIPTSPRLKLDVNPNPTKKGVKVQFILPKGYSTNQKEELTQKLKTKLNAGLAPHMMSVDVDLDVPYDNVIGFLIRLSNFKMLIKSILEGNTTETVGEDLPEEQPA
jgi:hypothetical protein